ncbi:unnamed protein product [Cuscuta epithymum]|uniref:Cytochrome P450 n=1 Tax=Cuscuta epithymum TaxID=186058 RepID=A0AAV0G8F0_9ASTE|nr:unnamed protein product [Cuscuta epithymum]CAH9144249.1 unnamed protein product [Cuscuta epithymum]
MQDIVEILCGWVFCLAVFYLLYIKAVPSKQGLPRSYPFAGHIFAMLKHRETILDWTADILRKSPTSTFSLRFPFGRARILTANPKNIQHIMKTRFKDYPKSRNFEDSFQDLFGGSLFLADGENWKKQRMLYGAEFHSKTFLSFIETITHRELSERMFPLLSDASAGDKILNMQDILRRFTFDVVARLGLGHDLAYLSPSYPEMEFGDAFDEAIEICWKRCLSPFMTAWKVRKLLDVGSEWRLRRAVGVLRRLIRKLIRERKEFGDDFLSRLMSKKISDETFLIDAGIAIVLGGVDTMVSAFTWLFWIIARHPAVEAKILQEIEDFDAGKIKDMPYIHATVAESMRLNPPVPLEGKQAREDDVWPDGTRVKKGMGIICHTYAVGRSADVWGPDWPEFKPERWLKKEGGGASEPERWSFAARDAFTYPVFQAGPRICLGKDIAFIQLKMVAVAVLRRFRVVDAAMAASADDSGAPLCESYISCRMTDGFPVRIVERSNFHKAGEAAA